MASSNDNKRPNRPVKSPVRGIIPGLYTHHRPADCYHILEGKPIHRQPEHATEGKGIVKIFAHDVIRELIVPAKEPINYPAIWPKDEFARIKNQAHVVSRKDRMDMIEEVERQKNKLHEESEERKKALLKAQQDQKSKIGSKLSEVEEAEKRRTEHLLKRAYEMQQDQEEEVKRANRMILATKCHAIRDAQVAEKELIKKELQEEELRLQKMMKEANKEQFRQEKRRKELEHEKHQKFVQEVLLQVKENELKRLYEAEKKEEDARSINRALIQMQREEQDAIKKKIENQRKIREDMNKFNDECKYYRQIEEEEERVADMRVREFMRQKEEREKEFAEGQMMAKLAKEREIERLRATQERQAGLQASTDELNALRAQEEADKKWRQQEREKAEKRVALNNMLKADRAKQIEDLRKMQALEIARDESEFYKVVEITKNLHEKELEKRALKKEGAMKHRKEILKQVADKEQERIDQRRKKFDEGLALKLEVSTRDRTIKDAIAKKVHALRDNRVPEQYIKEVARQLNVETN